jgi:hypothetical protein
MNLHRAGAAELTHYPALMMRNHASRPVLNKPVLLSIVDAVPNNENCMVEIVDSIATRRNAEYSSSVILQSVAKNKVAHRIREVIPSSALILRTIDIRTHSAAVLELKFVNMSFKTNRWKRVAAVCE